MPDLGFPNLHLTIVTWLCLSKLKKKKKINQTKNTSYLLKYENGNAHSIKKTSQRQMWIMENPLVTLWHEILLRWFKLISQLFGLFCYISFPPKHKILCISWLMKSTFDGDLTYLVAVVNDTWFLNGKLSYRIWNKHS